MSVSPSLGGEGRGEGGRKGPVFSLSLLALLFFLLVPSAHAVPQYLGDLNEDNQVDVRDLVILINHLNALRGSPIGSPLPLPYPLSFFTDVNQDGFQNQSDVDSLRDIILGKQPVVFFPLDMVIETSPAPGESGVSVTRETVFRFSQPLAASTALGTNHLFATFGGRRILSRPELSSDLRKVTLFYLENLPASARVRVTFNGEGLQDFVGRPLDPDGDGVGGGIKLVDFDTLSITPVAGTAIIGHVFASEQVPAQGTNTTNFVNRPLANVKIDVDGAEQTLVTHTDANGFFRLSPCPAGRFFVHIDGRTASNGIPNGHLRWDQRDYYPVVGKAWEAMAGRTNNLAAGTGLIYLPLVQVGTLQTVDPLVDTPVGFPPAVIAANPAWAGVSVTVPANALYKDDGTRGGRVGLAPVPSDRLPEKLPAGIVHALDISIQTDGPQNVDRPLPVRFPNLPDPQTGLKLPPGAKSALMSYNHDTGRWEVQGPMTVTADGNYVETDPGVGVRQPGWHGNMGGTQGGGGPITGPGTGPGPYNDDIDGDGIPNGQDDDVDGDGVKNDDDPDIDGDGIPNGQDSDMDGDGVPNNQDNDMDGDGVPNDQDDDPDGPDVECEVSILGPNTVTVGESLTLGSSVQPFGGEYGWALVGSGAVLSTPPGANGPGVSLSGFAPGTVTVYLTYRPPGANSQAASCSASHQVSIEAPRIEIVQPHSGMSFTTDTGTTFGCLTMNAQLANLPVGGQPIVTWEIRDSAYGGQLVLTMQGLSITPNIPVTVPPVPDSSSINGRGRRLSYELKASISVGGQTYSDTVNITQDATDQVRQQYVDLGRERPEKLLFNGGTSIPQHAALPPRIAQALPIYRSTATGLLNARRDVLEMIPIAQRTPAQNAELATIDANIQAIATYTFTVTSAYRTPYYNESLAGSVWNSLHQYGRASDIRLPPHLDVLGGQPGIRAGGIISNALSGVDFEALIHNGDHVHVEYVAGSVNDAHDGTCDHD